MKERSLILVLVLFKLTTVDKVCGFVLPSLNGLLAALETSSFGFQPRDFADLVSHSNVFLSSESSEHIRQAIASVKQDIQNSFARRVLSQYAAESVDLSSNRVVLQVLTVKRNMIASLLHTHLVKAQAENQADGATESVTKSSDEIAFSDIWNALLNNPVGVSAPGAVDLTKIMRTEYIMSLKFFEDMRSLTNELLSQGSSEIMGISLVSVGSTLVG